jgi:uncharacterized protein YPO0396
MSAGFDASVAGIRETRGQVKAWQARAEEAEARVAELRAELAKWKSAAETAEAERDAARGFTLGVAAMEPVEGDQFLTWLIARAREVLEPRP